MKRFALAIIAGLLVSAPASAQIGVGVSYPLPGGGVISAGVNTNPYNGYYPQAGYYQPGYYQQGYYPQPNYYPVPVSVPNYYPVYQNVPVRVAVPVPTYNRYPYTPNINYYGGRGNCHHHHH